jgi:hypothetical protein
VVVEQSQQPFRSERPQIFVRLHEAQPRTFEVTSREPVEHLDELQLVVAVVLEEEHDLLMVPVARKRRVASREVPFGLRQARPSAFREEAGAYIGKLFQREHAGDGTLVQHVPPRQDLAGQAGRPDPASGGISVGYEEYGLPLPLQPARERVQGYSEHCTVSPSRTSPLVCSASSSTRAALLVGHDAVMSYHGGFRVRPNPRKTAPSATGDWRSARNGTLTAEVLKR